MEEVQKNKESVELISFSAGELDKYEKRFTGWYVRSRATHKGRAKTIKKWYVIYLTTTILAVVAILFLLVFGVAPDKSPLAGGLVSLANKIADGFVGIDFFDLSGKTDRMDATVDDTNKVALPDDTRENTEMSDINVDVSVDDIYYFDYSKVPTGHIPIIPMDLSLSSFGSTYINNATGYTPDIVSLLKKNLNDQNTVKPLFNSSNENDPLVLIIHTHGTEAYSKDGAISHSKDDGDHARSSDVTNNIVSVGKIISDILNENNIPTAHCTIMHDSIQYKDSYARAEETVKRYLEEYPSIKLVIDIHRDSIVKSSGETVRPVTVVDGKKAAQIMCVVGSDWKGETCPNWQNNLSLALKLREKLNSQQYNLCRPVNLKGNTYNQELSDFSLLIEVGAAGNSLEEAQTSAKLIAEKLCELIVEIF